MDHTPRIRPEALVALRIDRRMSIAELAAAAGITGSQLYKIEKGLHQPRMATIRRLADALHADMAALLVKTPWVVVA